MPIHFSSGQRWVSEGEPELGLGAVRCVTSRTVTLAFGASEETRTYQLESAPVRRVVFRAGDRIESAEHVTLTVRSVSTREGLLYYDCGPRQLCETELLDTLSFSGPLERFFAGRFDPSNVFDLRYSAQQHHYRRSKAEVRGFLGGRIELLPHQLSIAAEVTGRLVPRVLLADEVGLGKTIEAGLILHRLLLTGRARRVLLLVPESLLHQWFLELLRRFNLWFHIFDEGRCQALEKGNPGSNPFLDDQLLLCDLGLFTEQAQRLQQALDAGWDLLVVDEAHHLGWSPEAASPEYTVVETLGRLTPGLLLLTATPEQLGMAGHFARLRLLDPDRFYDLEAFTREAEGYLDLAHLAEQLRSGPSLAADEVTRLARLLAESEASVRNQLRAIAQGDEATREAWLAALLDQHGTGRVMFRNTRATVTGFPQRLVHLHPLACPEPGRGAALAKEWTADTDPEARARFQPNFAQDPRIPWLAGLLKALGQAKVLLICHTRNKAEAILTALQQCLTLKAAVFHDGLSLVQRDRSAAWFAEKNGARLLVCSELGSEGRNFQFAHHLVLFDLPLDPALLEQRIGRLDRIGQTAAIHIHVPFVLGSHQEVLARWYQEGLNAFAENLRGGRQLLELFSSHLRQLAGHFTESRVTSALQLEQLIKAAQVAREEVAAHLEQGRDRLLEWNSCQPEVAKRLIDKIHQQDDHHALEQFLLATLDLFFIDVEEVAPRTYQLGSAGVLLDALPGLTSEGLTLTCDRQRALAREDLQFLTWDHPLVTGMLDLLLGSEQGNSSFAQWPDAKVSGLYLEAIYRVECCAPLQFHLDRFLPPTPVRVLVNQRGQEVGSLISHRALARHLQSGEGQSLLQRSGIRESLLPRLLEQTRDLANRQLQGLVALARQAMRTSLEQETSRLRDLQKVNRSVRSEEIALLIQHQGTLDAAIAAARLRLDALRLIHRGRCDTGLS